jgi:hypothetical protein
MAANSNIELFKNVMDEVYGKYEEGKPWRPKPYQEGKGRYLWTDAFGVCNFLTLYYETGEKRYLNQADLLIQDVHNVLGKDREGKRRLDDATDEEPTKGGLRIGKVDPEGTSDGDGQYFHYLTKWMYALSRMTVATKDMKYNNWAIQMVKAVHPKFVYRTGQNELHMYWKMSIDLSRPAVKSEGNLDPYDGYITYRILAEVAQNKEILKNEIDDMASMVHTKYKFYRSNDPLDLGEALWIAHFYVDEGWADTITTRSLQALEMLWKEGQFNLPARYRLGFREFGTTIGAQVNPKAGPQWKDRVKELHNFWAKNLYTRDKDITPVMFCTSLIPGTFSRHYSKMQQKTEL